MKHYHKNPRQITKKQRADLSRWLRELGDLSGVVHDLNSGEIIGGNMRGDVFNINECEITYTVKYDEPDYQGTLALGYVLWQDALYNYREVRWTPEKCEQGNIVANKGGGTFDFDILANEFEQVDLLEWGFEPFELGRVADNVDYDEMWQGMPEFEQGDNSAYKTIKVHFLNDDDYLEFADLIDQPLTEKTISIYYPKQLNEDLKKYETV